MTKNFIVIGILAIPIINVNAQTCKEPSIPAYSGANTDYLMKKYDLERKAYEFCAKQELEKKRQTLEQQRINNETTKTMMGIIQSQSSTGSNPYSTSWQNATYMNQYTLGGISGEVQCIYVTDSAYRFSIKIYSYSQCPLTVKYNPSTNQVQY